MRRFRAGFRLLPTRRPRGVTLVAVGVLIMACLSLTRAILALQDWAFLEQQPGATPVYLLVTGVVWTVAGFWVWFGLWWSLPWAVDGLRGLALVYSLFIWLERLFLVDRPAQAAPFQPRLPEDWLFLLAENLLLLVGVFWISSPEETKIETGEADE